jgi:hypothetical protein
MRENRSEDGNERGVKRAVQRLLWRCAPQTYRRMQRQVRQEFSIGIATGKSPFNLELSGAVANPVLTRDHVIDVPAAMVGDPFMCEDRGRWYMFFEVVNQLTRRGEIGLAVSADAMNWEYQRIVLAAPFHLSYPYVFEWQGSYYMIPESSRGGAVSLYKAAEFPDRWIHAGTLLEGRRYADSSILHYHDHWWLFTDAGEDSSNPVLRLFFSDSPFGPWQEHRLCPIRTGNPHVTRPAGRLIVVDNTPIRFAQDVYPVYGSKVYAFAITKLTTTEYEERPVSERAVLEAGSDRWNRHGMHHVDAHQRPDGSWIACVDGFQQHDISR